MTGKVYSININNGKGVPKSFVDEGRLIEKFGLEGDAHAGKPLKEVCLLSIESIRKLKECPKAKSPAPFKEGDFSENITTEGLDLSKLTIGSEIKIGEDVVLQVTIIGKECKNYCALYAATVDCAVPGQNIFATVVKGGIIRKGDAVILQ